ncbi:phage tail tape measure protein [Streptomyces ipomoeae]|uniref:phage tail tape measure protein n=1 Tax=Streptomyces ipomoeae TaxID=103232 RepID=UPI0011462422|nr:phage tail tape measure protein [Streptomyces ipomoeae]TQE35478.1 phage tail tape measure protein [Streptomyces ipomoeae]
MTILEELLVRLGVDLSDTDQSIDSSADRIDRSLDSIEDSADSLGTSVAEAADDTAAALDDVAASAQGVQGEAEQAATGVEGALGGIAGGVAGAAVGAMFMEGLNSALDIASAETTLQQGFGLTEAEAARAGDLAGDVFSAGFSDSMGGVSDAMGNVVSAMGGLGDFTDVELQDMTKSALALGDVFQMDIPEATNAAGALIKQGLVKDGQEAFDVLTKAAQTLPASMAADIPAIVSEYGTHFKRIGLDAQTAFGMMSQFVQAGGRDIDQAADVLHEFARITSEETDRATEGFKELGLNADQMLTDIGKGGKPAADALNLTLEALRGVKDPAKQAQLGVALFGDMAGEAAGALLAMNPATAAAESGMDKAAGAAKRVTEGMAASPAQQWESIMRTVSHTLGEALLPALNFVADLMKEHPGLIQVLVPVVLALAVGLGMAAAAQWALNSALLANPYTWIVLAVVAIVAAIVLLWKRNEAFRNFVTGAWRVILGAIQTAWQWVKSNWPLVLGILTGPVGMAVGAIVNYWDDIVAFVTGLPGRISRAARGMWDGVVAGFKNAVNSIIYGWNSLSLTIGGGSFMGVDIPTLTLNTPDIPYLAKGGITTGPTFAMIGEGREQEAVLPLSRLENMINTARAPSTAKVAPVETRVVLELRGGPSAFREFLQESVRTVAGGSIVKYAEG